MRLVFVITTLEGGGAEKALVVLANSLVQAGVKITIVCLESARPAYQVDERVQVITLYTSSLARGLGKIVFLPLQALELARVLRRLRPDATVSLLVRPNLAHVLSRWFGNVRPIVVCEQLASKRLYQQLGLPGQIMMTLTSVLYSQADRILTASAGVWQGLQEIGVKNDNVTIIHNPISLAEIPSRQEPFVPATPERPFKIVTMGRLCEQKDHPTLLRAFARVVQNVDAELWILGAGPDRAETEALIASLGLLGKVKLLGFQSDPFEFVRQCDLFVLSSRYEGFGNVVVEAMACQIPVVSTDCPSGPAEILEGGKYGRLTPIEDPNALADAMLWTLSQDCEVLAEMGRRNRQRAADFDVSEVAPRYLAALGLPIPASLRPSKKSISPSENRTLDPAKRQFRH